jgi:hypothetical protein
MKRKTVAWMLGAAAIVLSSTAACGGRFEATTADGGAASNGGGSGGGDGVTCTPQMGGGSSSGPGGGCEVSTAGTCSDDTDFDINCSCPAATCTCSKQTTSSGTQTSQVSIACPQACSQSGSSLVEACNFGSSQITVTPPADAGLPACTIPASMEPPSQPHAWTVGRALISCKGNGLNTICISDNGTTCPDDPVTVGSSCTDECAPDEYAVGYGGPPTFDDDAGGYLTPPLIASCSGGDGLPSGTSLTCCPCQ